MKLPKLGKHPNNVKIRTTMESKFLIFAVLVTMVTAGSPYNRPAYKKSYNNNKPNYDYNSDIPLCAKNTTKPWCLQDSDYPLYDVQYALEQHYDAVLSLYKDVALRTGNSVDGIKSIDDETYLCPSATSYVQPLRAVNVDGKWRVVVNRVEVIYYKFEQSARIEECEKRAVNKACPLVPSCYESKCVQKSIYHRFLVYDPTDYYFPFAVESFKLPASCACKVGAYAI